MKIAIVHYHLRRGGVTQVISNAIDALRTRGHEIVVVSGENPSLPETEEKPCNVVVVDGLGYRDTGSASEATATASEIQARVGKVDLWHFHNHALGKNVMMPMIAAALARETPVLLQTHDFAEDGRPENFHRQLAFDPRCQLWPQAPQIHYATINYRDFNLLRRRGFPRLSVLPNAVNKTEITTSPHDRPFAEGKKFYLYPTRAIRRKNIGELLLHSHFHRDKAEFATTLVPENPEWLAIHQHWKNVAADLKLPVSLGDHGHHFTDLIGWSDGLISTSVAEGFGLAFLEPWLAGKSIVGRDLTEITADFPVNLNHLYGRFDVPIDLISLSELKTVVRAGLENHFQTYKRDLPAGALESALSSMIRDDKVDFGRLNEPLQTRVLENPKGIVPPSIDPSPEAFISEQTGLVRQTYSVDSYGEKLESLYKTVAVSEIGEIQNPGPEILLDSFLDPDRFNLLLT